jgi:hypothetical protein
MKLSSIILAEGAKAMLSSLTYDQVAKALGDSRFSAPNPDDSLRGINDERSWEDWKAGTIKKWGDVEIELNPEAVWFNKVKILDPAFNKRKTDYTNAKGAWLDKERSAGRSSDLD